jgi:putative NADH-flavin reductase
VERGVRITIFAATGGVGREALKQALAAGHEVTAAVRNPGKLSEPANAVAVDLSSPDPAALQRAVDGSDAVLSCLGAPARGPHGIVSRGTRAIVEAMEATGTRRLVVVSAALIGNLASPGRPNPPKHDPGDGFFMRHFASRLAQRFLRDSNADLALMEDVLRASDLEWTAMRPPRLNDKPLTGKYRTAYGQNLKRGLYLSRADVAHAMLHALEDPKSIRQTVGVAY